MIFFVLTLHNHVVCNKLRAIRRVPLLLISYEDLGASASFRAVHVNRSVLCFPVSILDPPSECWDSSFNRSPDRYLPHLYFKNVVLRGISSLLCMKC